jgi:cytosine/adenosine deaminase-related metal-dependent hydrolase
MLDAAVEKIGTLGKSARNAAGFGPHAPYSTVPELLRLTAETARQRGWLLATHAAESVEEFEMFQNSRGVMFDWLARNQRDNSDCGLGSPVAHLARNDMLGENLTVIHANLLVPGDAELLGRHHVHVVHCPRSHDYFSHPPFPRRQLADAGVNLCLGTDSLSTVRKIKHQKLELNLFEEMRRLAAADKNVSPVEILRMATVNGAKALGMAGQIGELSENAFADLIAIPFAGKKADIYDTVLHHASTVAASMIDGQWAIAP